MIQVSISTIRLSFNGSDWVRYETASMIQYCAESSSDESYMFSGKNRWLYRKDRFSFWQSCEEPNINKEYDTAHGTAHGFTQYA